MSMRTKFLRLALLGSVVASLGLDPALAQEPKRGGTITVATVGEPTTLDPMVTTADLVGAITMHVFETLYTFGDGLTIVPLLAESDPIITDGGKTYTIKLRQGVKFHDGSVMTSADVLASFDRWKAVADRGKTAWSYLTSVTAPDAHTIELKLKEPYAPLLALLSLNNNAAAIMPASNQANPMTKYIGTGPYTIKERRPDQFVVLARFPDYTPRSDKPTGYGGRRTAYIDEIRYVPVPDPNTRVEGSLSGQYDYADSLPVAAMPRLQGQKEVTPVLQKNFGYPTISINNKGGLLTNMTLRQALFAAVNNEDMLKAAFGSTEFYTLSGSLYPEGFRFHTKEGIEAFNQNNPAKARELAAKAGYKGEPIRFLTTTQFDHFYKIALVATETWRKAGFNIDLQVVDWGTLLTRRNNPALYEMSTVGAPFLAEPSLTFTAGSERPGWWSSEAKDRVVGAFNAESDPAKRAAMFGEVQKLIYAEVPYIKVGDYNVLRAKSNRLQGVIPSSWSYFWNAWVDK